MQGWKDHSLKRGKAKLNAVVAIYKKKMKKIMVMIMKVKVKKEEDDKEVAGEDEKA